VRPKGGARLARQDDPVPIDVARRFSITEPGEIDKLKRWLMLNDED